MSKFTKVKDKNSNVVHLINRDKIRLALISKIVRVHNIPLEKARILMYYGFNIMIAR